MKKIAIVVGHGPQVDKGATNANGTNELHWNHDLAQQISKYIAGRAEVVIVNRVTERVQPTTQTNSTRADCAIELHLNSFNRVASGTEMIYYQASARGKILAQLLQNAAVDTLNLKDRGIKGPQGGGRGSGWLSGTRMPAVIVESFFIDNNSDLRRGNEKKSELARAYANALVQFVNL